MLKKMLILFLLSMCTFVLAGCTKVQSLTENETQMIAEYAAGLLLKYDLNYVDRINEGEKEAREKASEEENQGNIEAMVTEQATEEEVTTEAPDRNSNISDRIDSDNISSEDMTATGQESDIAQIAGINGVSITYRDYLITDHYPADDEGNAFVYLDASEGYQLLVVRFRVTGQTEEMINASLIDKELDYRIVCNGTKAANPMITILPDDLKTLDTTVNAGEEQDAVLIFQISNEMTGQLESIELYIDYNDISNEIKIL